MEILRNYSLKNFNTFGIDATAKSFVSINSIEDLKKCLRKIYASELFVLGGGSNMLLTKDVDATVIHINLMGKKVVREDENHVWVKARAGENWHQFVLWCLDKDYGGLENLSLIPGNVGTTPIQNIGAYGVELKESFVECETMDLQSMETRTFNKEECQFGYRDSVFKNGLKGRYVITSVLFKLTKINHQINDGYGSMQREFEKRGITDPTIQDVSDVVVAIRSAKLPDPNKIGNSGSFFKNPILSKIDFEEFQKAHPEAPHYKLDDGRVKVPAGWLIDTAGFKGYREKDAGVHKNQALVLVNYGNATGEEILNLSKKIQKKIKEEFGIELDTEVNII